MSNCHKSSVACVLYEGHDGPCQSYPPVKPGITIPPLPDHGGWFPAPDPRDAEIARLRAERDEALAGWNVNATEVKRLDARVAALEGALRPLVERMERITASQDCDCSYGAHVCGRDAARGEIATARALLAPAPAAGEVCGTCGGRGRVEMKAHLSKGHRPAGSVYEPRRDVFVSRCPACSGGAK